MSALKMPTPLPGDADSDVMDKEEPSLKSTTMRAGAWSMGGFAVGNVLRLASNIILAWLLVDDIGALGLMALVNTFLQGLRMFSDVGLNFGVIQHKRGGERVFVDTAWSLQVIRGIVLWMACWAFAVPFARFYGEPILATLIPLTGLMTVMNGFGSPGLLLARRNMDLKKLTFVELGSQIAGLVVMLTWAFNSPSVWALVAGNLTGSAFRLVSSHIVFREYRARFGWNKAAASALLRFGGWIFVATTLTFASTQIDKLAFGKVFDVWSLGIFAVAATFSMVPTQAVLRLGNQVVFPAYAKVVNRGDDLSRVLDRVRLPILTGTGLAASGLYATGPWLVGLLYLPQFQAAGWMLRLLAVGMLARVLSETSKAALLAIGHSREVALGQAMKIVGFTIAAPIGYHLGGMVGFVAAIPIAEACRYLSISLLATWRGLRVLPGDLETCWLTVLGGVLGLGAGDAVAGAMGAGKPATLVAFVAAGLVSALPWIPHLRRSVREFRRDTRSG
ncbi:MAG TPA: polysaccharide biosynthesis protein [Phycisphaerales bacterium]|nr:polysaccharide biosynthesis protein [Phycisphaerales bacterium]